MEARKSSLNPYASSYIPLSQGGRRSDSRPQMNPGNSFSNGKTSLTKSSDIHKNRPIQDPDEESEMDLAYLASRFPDLSEQSLAGVYYANASDVEATVDMLKLLEGPDEFTQQLPDTLDIGDVPESESLAEGNAAKSKAKSGEASRFSSGVSKYVQ